MPLGGDGDYDDVGGLVGRQEGGTITASYATGVAAGGDGDFDYVGGAGGLAERRFDHGELRHGRCRWRGRRQQGSAGWVGQQEGGTITASYATGAAAGGAGNGDNVGGLVGWQRDGSSITASYATGVVAGGDGDFDSVGGLVGFQFGSSITASYGFGSETGGELEGSAGSTKPVGTAAQLTAANAGLVLG